MEAGLIAIDDGVTRFRLDSGESHEMTGSGLTRIRNPESGRAVVWLASLKEPNSASAYEQDSSDLPSGVTITPLAWGSQFEPEAAGRARTLTHTSRGGKIVTIEVGTGCARSSAGRMPRARQP